MKRALLNSDRLPGKKRKPWPHNAVVHKTAADPLDHFIIDNRWFRPESDDSLDTSCIEDPSEATVNVEPGE
jgi:hypothetical protein